ncbi:MAG: isoprenylcysteine carboxylmethyltransferase family protein [Pseudomonadota bacterium]
MMEEFRYVLALVIIVIMPLVIAFWVVIHGGSDYWRMHDPKRAYGVAGILVSVLCAVTLFYRKILVGADLGTNWALLLLGAMLYLASWLLWRPVKRYLDFRTFAGVPEVMNSKIELIREGPFAIVRHPRYLMVAIGVVGWCMMSNFAGAYFIGGLSIFGLMMVIRLEERDLVKRFDAQYRDYQTQVPAFIPTWSGVKRFFSETIRNQEPGNG